MFDASGVMIAAEVLKLALQLSGDAQYILQSNVDGCGNAPFVHVAGDLNVAGDLALDWDAPPWNEGKRCGLVVEGNLDVEGRLTNFNMNGGPVLVVLGSVRADDAVQGGASWLIRDDFEVTKTFLGYYNDGHVYVGGDLTASAVINMDHSMDVTGRINGTFVDLENGHAFLVNDLLIDGDPDEVDWDLAWERAKRNETLLRASPAGVDIFRAAMDRNPDLLVASIAAGGDVESRDEDGDTPLLVAARTGNVASMRTLFDSGASASVVNARKQGLTHVIAWNDNEVLLDIALSPGPPLDEPDSEGHTPMMLALDYRNVRLVRRLAERGVPFPEPEEKTAYPYSLFLAQNGEVELLSILIGAGVDLEWTDADDYVPGKTLLHEAAWRGNVTSVEMLVRAGVAIDPRESRGRTPLRLMLDLAQRVMEDNPEDAVVIARILIDGGADPLAKADDGRDALDAAFDQENVELLRVVYAGVDPDRLDDQRRGAVNRRLSRR